MVIGAIKNDNKSKGINVLGAAFVGGVTGYSLKYALPVNPYEKDNKYFEELSRINVEAKIEKIKRLAGLKERPDNKILADTFEKITSDGKITHSRINALEDSVKGAFLEEIKNANAIAKDVRLQGRLKLDAYTKKIRPTSPMVLLGMGITVTYALLHNIIKRIRNHSSK